MTEVEPDTDDDRTDPANYLLQLRMDADEWPDRRTIKPAGPLFELLKAQKQQGYSNWDHYLTALYLATPADMGAAVDTEALAADLAKRLDVDDGEVSISAAELGDSLARSFDYEHLAGLVADELQGRLG